jgi:hypothetical protein
LTLESRALNNYLGYDAGLLPVDRDDSKQWDFRTEG